MARSSPGQPAPGWYSDPGRPTAERFWDGAKWTDQTRPGSSRASAQSWHYAGPQPRSNNLIIAGWIVAFIFPIAGLIIGYGLLTRNEERSGKPMMLVSAVVLVAYIIALAAG